MSIKGKIKLFKDVRVELKMKQSFSMQCRHMLVLTLINAITLASKCHFFRGLYKPWNKGHNSHVPMPPFDINCPRLNSKKNTGTPPIKQQMKYGIRKAPVNR